MSRSAEILGGLWRTLGAPLATEVGALTALVTGAVAGIGAGFLALVVLELWLPRVRPPDGLIRLAILVAGPPLRYVLLLAAAGKVWLSSDGPIMALLLVLALAFLLPLGAFLILQSRARAG